MSLYLYSQNNSGGYYITPNFELGVGTDITIEADNEEEADAKFDEIEVLYDKQNESKNREFYSYCECCGWRWSEPILIDLKYVSERINKNEFINLKDGTLISYKNYINLLKNN